MHMKFQIVLIILLLSSTSNCQVDGERIFEDMSMPVESAKDSVLITGQMYEIKKSLGNLKIIRADGKVGLITSDHRVIIEPELKNYIFNDDYANSGDIIVDKYEDKYGALNFNSDTLIPFIYQKLSFDRNLEPKSI